MDVEHRLLLYVVVLGCVVGVGTLLYRRSRDYNAHGFQLVALAAAATAGLLRESTGAVLAWPLFASWGIVAVAPSMLLSAGRGAATRRRYTLAAGLVAVAAGVLFLPRPLRREARLYAALAAADRGDVDRCRRMLEQVALHDRGGPSPESSDLVALIPAAAARRWDEVLRAVDAARSRTPFVVTAEATAAAESGDVARALRAVQELGRGLPDGSPSLAQARRALLSATGRATFLEEAVREELPVAEGPSGAAALSIARAYEAAGQAEPAARAYRAAAAAADGAIRRDADEGARRAERGELRLAVAIDEAEATALRDLESACRAERADPSSLPLHRRAPVTVAICLGTVAVSLLVFATLGHDVLSLVAAGALSAPLVERDGEWWRLASAIVLHGGVVHLLLNVTSIFVISVPYEERMGPVRTGIVYLASGLLASVASVAVTETDVGVGASGAAMGVFGALCTLLLFRARLFEPAERRQWIAACAVVLVANGLIGAAEHEAVDNAAHAGGLVAGAVIAWMLLPHGLDTRMHRGARRLVAFVLLAVVVVSTGAVLRDVRDWRGEADIVVSGVTVRVPAWLRFREADTVGAVGARTPLPFAVQVGRIGRAAPDPYALAARALDVPDAEARQWAGETRNVTERDGVSVEEVRWPQPKEGEGPGPEMPMIAYVLQRGDAFAVASLPDDDEGHQAFDAAVRAIERTLGAASEGSPR